LLAAFTGKEQNQRVVLWGANAALTLSPELIVEISSSIDVPLLEHDPLHIGPASTIHVLVGLTSSIVAGSYFQTLHGTSPSALGLDSAVLCVGGVDRDRASTDL
jgi:hypothetical protein